MPELPEVEVVRAGLQPAVTDAVVTGVEIFDERSLRRHVPAAESFTAQLSGRRILAAVRRGKFLWLPLDSGRALVIHLGMSGQVLLRTPGAAADRMLRIRLTLDHPTHGELWVNFVDQRIFGSMAVDSLVATTDGLPGGYWGTGETDAAWQRRLPSQVAHIARDPIDASFSSSTFLAVLARKNTGIKRALLDQNVISGIGNIYADEALFAARIHYEQPAASLSRAKATALLAAVRAILHRALAEGGTSFDAQYVNVNGQSGYFAHSLEAYGRQGAPCSRCGTLIVREQFMNRGSHFCPRCQRLR
ncbi:bifunctional DNA-formamidopyrimidine glycosylase/DNA-(apurinic or apyrimidinic site) lyase [Cryobacterium sp. TMT1-3]|uniref:Formamidopyrimidine-DNA glycosylase n=1 Tax=Cryobacterium luteum TaxID=1424661 RepID=A0A1H8EZF7_9MICO|nr:MULTISPECIES: bifunctional DNA-formamidopyrimidine glycosylase/DNA-(apurinic or apyrimidinic site) lyase [Cryobacterium]TFB85459.1 bifunctional DNA-formamidopyrimidine glycosylase/DNA-(apurinic or apyrimidinic site) lyase [Cryobacterium luteum]TFC26637.1 bifunctional DNA-formamidopyrimidine glycosylase/DNA-(apurinic or apyrimidinic site) lyase [Cryobacterium sp. TMT1-3]SEN24776.1 formamidopyrimidine-DNA glycosylase [Cryobacterium luteum]